MKVKLAIVRGPQQGREFVFDGRDTFLVGRADDAHFRLSEDDLAFSRRHFLLEINPPRCRLTDLGSRNGTLLNGVRVQSAELKDGDKIEAGFTVLEVRLEGPKATIDLPVSDPDRTADEPLGAALPGYRILGELGRGGMGVVWRAVRENDGRAVALKTISPAKGADGRCVERFLRECRILGGLSHANIVRCEEVKESGGLVFLAMELVDGPDLAGWLRTRGTEDWRTAVRIMCQVLAGLAHAHERGIVHRDIKPANILIGGEGARKCAKLADFGLARAYEESRMSGLTMQGDVGGTPAFMAPEQVTHYREVKPAADQFSAAATLYKMLTGKLIHDMPADLAGQIAGVVTKPPVPITERRKDLPAGLADVVMKALSREPAERWTNVPAFRAELRKFA